jgi:hypothetical protein
MSRLSRVIRSVTKKLSSSEVVITGTGSCAVCGVILPRRDLPAVAVGNDKNECLAVCNSCHTSRISVFGDRSDSLKLKIGHLALSVILRGLSSNTDFCRYSYDLYRHLDEADISFIRDRLRYSCCDRYEILMRLQELSHCNSNDFNDKRYEILEHLNYILHEKHDANTVERPYYVD